MEFWSPLARACCLVFPYILMFVSFWVWYWCFLLYPQPFITRFRLTLSTKSESAARKKEIFNVRQLSQGKFVTTNNFSLCRRADSVISKIASCQTKFQWKGWYELDCNSLYCYISGHNLSRKHHSILLHIVKNDLNTKVNNTRGQQHVQN